MSRAPDWWAAASLLTGAGRLWMVANRHLPYEAALAEHFGDVAEIGGDNRFKIISATGARRAAARGAFGLGSAAAGTQGASLSGL